MFKGLMHEIIHHLYKYYVYGEEKERITWVDEGLAQLLSGQKDSLQEKQAFKNFVKENLKEDSDINLNELNHNDRSFGNQNGYNLSYIAIRYLHDKLKSKEFLKLLQDEKRLKSVGKGILKEINIYYNFETANVIDNVVKKSR